MKMYANWDRMDPAMRDAYRASATDFLATLKSAANGWAQ